ncbi:MAG TPA: arabinofuranosidase catalytic domain-containing protein [Polyangiaceae bacterium]|nr:arabinofuranosidase catalytic domain-containing protein [Polyangiaceae bacterium]
MKVQSVVLTMMAALVASNACTATTTPEGMNNPTAGTGSGTAGSASPTAGSGSGTGGSSSMASCENVTACGGAAVGTWTVASSCLKVAGSLDLQTLFGFTCPSGQVSGSLDVTGSVTFNADGTFTDNTTTTGMHQVTLPVDCLTLSGAPVTCERLADVMSGGYYKKVTCAAAAAGGCACTATVDQQGSLGHSVSEAQKEGNFTTADGVLSITQDSSKYGYCVSDQKLVVTPQTMGPTTTGSVLLQSASSSGGAGGSGGASAGGTNAGGSAGSAGSSMGGNGGSGGTGPLTRGKGPCDIYGAANTPCVAAYSMVRALSSTYNGPLYQVRNMSSATNTGSGGMTKDIMMTADGYADISAQDTFCNGTICTVSVLYDQSGNQNDLKTGAPGNPGNGARSGEQDYESIATKGAVTAGGHKVYSLYMNQYEGYRTPLNQKGKNVPLGNTNQAIYMLADGKHFGTQCCWDFGNVTTNPKQYHTMNTLFFGKGFWGKGNGDSPWFEADFEGGVWAGGAQKDDPGGSSGATRNDNNPTLAVDFALGMLKTSSGKYALRMADAATATDLKTAYDGAAPVGQWDNQGGILLGVGGDNSNNSFGTFYEGAVVAGIPTTDIDQQILKNIQAVGYKK